MTIRGDMQAMINQQDNSADDKTDNILTWLCSPDVTNRLRREGADEEDILTWYRLVGTLETVCGSRK